MRAVPPSLLLNAVLHVHVAQAVHFVPKPESWGSIAGENPGHKRNLADIPERSQYIVQPKIHQPAFTVIILAKTQIWPDCRKVWLPRALSYETLQRLLQRNIGFKQYLTDECLTFIASHALDSLTAMLKELHEFQEAFW